MNEHFFSGLISSVCIRTKVLTFGYFLSWIYFSFLGPNIWLEYGQYSVGGIGQKGGLEKVRSVFERALSSVGLHMTKGLAIWEAYREFESAIVEAARVSAQCLPSISRLPVFVSGLGRTQLTKRSLPIPWWVGSKVNKIKYLCGIAGMSSLTKKQMPYRLFVVFKNTAVLVMVPGECTRITKSPPQIMC